MQFTWLGRSEVLEDVMFVSFAKLPATLQCHAPDVDASSKALRFLGQRSALIAACFLFAGCSSLPGTAERAGNADLADASRLASNARPIGDSATTAQSNETNAFGRVTGAIKQKLPKPFTRTASHSADWRPDLMVLPFAEIEHDRVRLHNIRDCEYRTEENYDVRHFDRQILLQDVRTIDFIVVPFKETPAIAHTMLSFGLADGEHIVFSVEARLEQGETYSAIPSATKKYELIWLVGTERDLIRLRTDVRDVDVYLYPTRATPEQVQRVFLAAVARVNEIARTPEYYDLLSNNCTTNIVDMLNQLQPGYIPPDLRIVLPGHSDKLAYDLGLLAVDGPFEMIKAASKINLVAKLNSNSPDFSRAIRQMR